ncbi:unnamed protein product [Meganyctiphanes norvegica]|uniref:Uncharacterized protein n=1 Tax=Meganyctiphanes norvegica TaxID=48144 RepID=A0AAV2QF71_MEGNR
MSSEAYVSFAPGTVNKDRLAQAVGCSDAAEVGSALAMGYDPNTAITWPMGAPWFTCLEVPLLTVAVHQGSLDIVTLLLKKKVNSNKRRGFPKPPAVYAASRNQTDILAKLLEAGADANLMDNLGCTCLHWAAHNNSVEALELLLEHKVDLNLCNKLQFTALHWAADNGSSKAAQWLVNHGGNRKAKNCLGQKPLDLAIRSGHIDLKNILE